MKAARALPLKNVVFLGLFFTAGFAFMYWKEGLWGCATIILGAVGPLAALMGLFAALYLLAIIAGAVIFVFTARSKRERRLAIMLDNFGRKSGWYVEYQGRRIAVLTSCKWADMFWDEYHVQLLTDDPEERRRIAENWKYWVGDDVVYRSRQFPEALAPNAFPAGPPCPPTRDRIVMRALYLCLKPGCSPFEDLVIRWRLRRRRQQGDTSAGPERL